MECYVIFDLKNGFPVIGMQSYPIMDVKDGNVLETLNVSNGSTFQNNHIIKKMKYSDYIEDIYPNYQRTLYKD